MEELRRTNMIFSPKEIGVVFSEKEVKGAEVQD